MIGLERRLRRIIRSIFDPTVSDVVADDGRFFERFFPFTRCGFSIVYSSREGKQ